MKRLIAALGFTFLVPPAFAMTTLSTSYVFIPATDSGTCFLANVTSKQLIVTVSTIAIDGTTIGSAQTMAQPQHGRETSFTGGTFVRCTFAFSGSSKSLRAGLIVVDGGTNAPLVSLPAS